MLFPTFLPASQEDSVGSVHGSSRKRLSKSGESQSPFRVCTADDSLLRATVNSCVVETSMLHSGCTPQHNPGGLFLPDATSCLLSPPPPLLTGVTSRSPSLSHLCRVFVTFLQADKVVQLLKALSV